jgi:hypothetical protein
VIPSLPSPVALPEPPGSPEALGQVVDQLATAGYAAGLTVHLLGPAAPLVGWQGSDAVVAAAEVGTAMGVAADLHEAVTVASARLGDHLELWLSVRARVRDLRDEQRARFADAGARLAALVGVPMEHGGPIVVLPEARSLVDDVAREDAARGVEHRSLLGALADDAGSVSTALAAATRPFGGTGRPGSAAAVTARLAVDLPGWGAGALATLGSQAADELTHPGPGDTLAGAVARWRPYASLPGFADALLGSLGAGGLTWLLAVLAGPLPAEQQDALAGLLAVALSGPGTSPGRRGGEVLAAVRLDPDDPDATVDGRAVAMGRVLAAPGAGAALAAAWGRQVLDREAAQGAPAGAAAMAGSRLPDAAEAALAVIARSGDAGAAASLLDDPRTWTTLLARSWSAGTAALAAVVGLAGTAPGAGRAASAVLLALGQGLAPGSAGRVLDDRGALSRVRAEVSGLVAGQSGTVLPVLRAAATGGDLDRAEDTALRGLGYLVAEPASATELSAAVRAALQSGAAGSSAGGVAGAHVAVLEYGQRLRYALDWSAEQSRAVDADMVWTFAVQMPVQLIGGHVGELAGVVEEAVADALGANGDVEIGPDTGEVRTAEDAARFAVEALGRSSPGVPEASAAAARAGFVRAGEVLGRLAAPGESLLDRLSDLSVPEPSSRRGRGR